MYDWSEFFNLMARGIRITSVCYSLQVGSTAHAGFVTRPIDKTFTLSKMVFRG